MNPPSAKILLIFFIAFLLTGCSVQKPFYNKNETDWQEKTLPKVGVKYTAYLLGSLGDEEDSTGRVLDMLRALTEGSDTNHAILFLSDHVYRKGIPADDSEKTAVLDTLNEKLSFLKTDKGKILFIPGSHDIEGKRKKKLAKLGRTHEAVEKLLGRKNIFLPEGDCPGPAVVELTDDWVVVPINTLWWLQEKKEKNTDCDNKDAQDWIDEVKDVIDNNQRKTILVLGHHPLLNVGHHGGYFSWKQHIFPFTDLAPWLYLPLPIVGSLYPMYRAGIGTPEDLAYPPYKQMRRDLFSAFKGYDNVIYASGHEHSLQYIKYNKQDFIISNASAQTDWAGRKQRAGFSYSSQGLVRIQLLDNGEVWMDFLVPDSLEPGGRLIFRKRLKDNSYSKPNDSTALQPYVSLKDSTVTVAANERLDAGPVREFWLGKHYRDAWTTPVEVPVLDLSKEQGGLTIVKKGGGFQTKSLQLRNEKGEEYTLRLVTKFTEEILGPAMQNTFAADIVKDQTSSTNPFAPYVVDDLSKAAGVYHSEPKLVYIPNDPKLAEYRKDFANSLALFEQRADGEMKPAANFGFAEETVNFEKMLKMMHEDNGNRHDEVQLLRSRLFDMWINDWDRHQNQWRWGIIQCTDKTKKTCDLCEATKACFIPLPKDRDQAFARFDGVMPWVAGRKWVLRKFQDFDPDVRDVPGLNFNARHLDHTLLTQLPESEWIRLAEELVREMDDATIEAAVRKMPDPVFQKDGMDIIAILKARRGHMVSVARKYYKYLAKEVNVTGSDMQEQFIVKRLNDDSTSVDVYTAGEEKRRLLYHRIFYTMETKEVRLYGLDGDDVFTVEGKVRKGILVRIVGGGGHDSISDVSSVRGRCKKTIVYDTKDKNVLDLGDEGKDHTSDLKTINEYDWHANNYNVVGPAAFFGYNVDDGLFVGGGIMMRYHGFRKKPYANYQRLVANTSVKEFIFNLKYIGDFNNVLGEWGIYVDVSVLAPKSTTNFYGLGNETLPALDAPELYYRIRYDEVRVFPALKRYMGKYQFLKIGPLYDYVKIEKTAGKYISSPDAEKYITDFTGRNFLGARLEYEVQKIDDSLMTLRGLRWVMAVNALREFKGTMTPVNLQGEVNAYVPLPNHSTLALRLGGAHLLGDYEFYLANSLGGQNQERRSGNLRGYQRSRFSGRSIAYLNTDVRIKLLSFRTYFFPARFGVLAFYDAARVWSDGEVSNTWHTGYGWGVWLMPFGAAVLNLTFGKSQEQSLTTLNIGFLF